MHIRIAFLIAWCVSMATPAFAEWPEGVPAAGTPAVGATLNEGGVLPIIDSVALVTCPSGWYVDENRDDAKAATEPCVNPQRTHTDDCTSITVGDLGEYCWEQDSNRVFVCEPTVGGCDTAAEWKPLPSDDGTLNVKDFGAVGNGVADDTAEIQAAVDAAATSGCVYLPRGNYKLSAAIAISSSDTCIYGDGYSASRLMRAAGVFNMISIAGGVDRIAIRDLEIDGTGGTAGTGISVAADTSTDLVFERLYVHDLGAGFGLQGERIRVIDSYIDDILGRGVSINSGATTARYVWVERNHITDTQSDLVSGNAAIQIQSASTAEYVWIRSNYISPGTGVVGIGADGGRFVWIESNTILMGGAGTGEGIATSGQDIVMSDNYVTNAGAAGILVFAGVNTEDIYINGNRSIVNLGQGLALVWAEDTADLKNIQVEDNVFTGNANYQIQSYLAGGVTVQAGYVNVDLYDNHLDTSGSGAANLPAGVTNTDLVAYDDLGVVGGKMFFYRLEAGWTFRLPPTDFAPTCQSSNEGTTYYDTSISKTCVCSNRSGAYVWESFDLGTVGTNGNCG